MGSESSLWKTLRKKMKGYWEPTRVENPAEPGTPDVYFTLTRRCMGWIELKHVHHWPKRETTKVKIEHYTPQQKGWIRRHSKAGANVMILVQVERSYFLFRYPDTQDVGDLTRDEMYAQCEKYWEKSIDLDDFIGAIQRY